MVFAFEGDSTITSFLFSFFFGLGAFFTLGFSGELGSLGALGFLAFLGVSAVSRGAVTTGVSGMEGFSPMTLFSEVTGVSGRWSVGTNRSPNVFDSRI
jgi:hypothetical protein